MNKLLYYPGFEISDQRWLKFALLYLENVSTIIPFEADDYLSNEYQLIGDETNLLQRYRPKLEETEKSSKDMMHLLDKYLKNPERYYGILGKFNVAEYWRQPSSQNFELFSSKLSYYLESFCMENGFGHRTVNGIKIPYQLGVIYMSVLAHNIGTRNNISVITDIKEERALSSINQDTWSYNQKFNELKSIKRLIELNLPDNIDNISINEIINFRNRESYQKKIQSFRLAVNNLNNLKNGNLNESNYFEIIKHIEENKANLLGDLLEFGSTFIQVGLGVFLAINNDSGVLETIKEIAGTGLVINGIQRIERNLRAPYREANKYITEIRNFHSRSNLSTKTKYKSI